MYGPGNYFELIPTVEMEARHPVESYYGSEFPRSVIIAELWRPEVKIKIFREIFSFSWKKRPIQVKFSKLVPKVFIATPIDVLCSNFVKFGQREIGEIVRCLPDKNKNSPDSPAVATARIALKICQGQPLTMYSECSRLYAVCGCG